MTTVTDTRYLYDGWNLIGEYRRYTINGTASWRPIRTYVWGPDLSGTDQGAGGPGGLVMVNYYNNATSTPVITTLSPVYDTNGNVQAYVNLTTGQVSHRIQYDAFGRELSQVNHTATASSAGIPIPPLRFSTKYTDEETGLVYFGYRYYSPEVERWTSRDPIGIRGGFNLYGMVRNDAVNRVDVLGLCCPGERQGCKVKQRVRVTPDEQKQWDDWDETKGALEDLTGHADDVSALGVASDPLQAVYDNIDDSDQEAIDAADATIPALLDYHNRLKNRNKPFTVYVVVSFKECEKKFFGLWNEFEDKVEKVGPFKVDYGKGGQPFPANAPPDAGELKQMEQVALDRICPKKK